MKKMLWFAAVLALAGCATPPPPPPELTFTPLPFEVAEYEALPKAGNGIVRGQVFSRTRGGDVKRGAGSTVTLTPITKASTQFFLQHILSGRRLTRSPDHRFAQYDMKKTADADGNYEFTDVPPGNYYVISKITWLAIDSIQGGYVTKQIKVEDDRITEAMLTR